MSVINIKTVQSVAYLLLLILLSPTTGFGFAQTDDPSLPKPIDAGPFRIHVPVTQKEVVQQVTEVGESTWEIASRLYGSELPKRKLDVHLYRNRDEFNAADKKLTGGQFEKNQAFAHHDSQSAHVALQPPVSDDLLKTVGLPRLSAGLLAHEMAHLVRFNHMPHSFKDHPQWLVDGVASFLDQRVLAATGYSKDPEHDPDFGFDCRRVRKLLEHRKLPSATTLLDNQTLEVGFYHRYSVRGIFVSMLASKYPTEFQAFLQDLRRLGGGPNFAERSKKLLLEHLAVDAKTLDRQFEKYVESLSPVWCEAGRSLETFGPEWNQISFPGSTATCWRQSALNDSFTVSTTATIHNAGGNQLNIRIGQRESFSQISITAGYGLNVFQFADGEWNMGLKEKVDGIKINKPIKLSIEHDHRTRATLVKLDGKNIFEGKMTLGTNNKLALGVQNGSAVTWEKLRVE